MHSIVRRLLGLTAVSVALISPRAATAQVRLFEACSQGPLQNCATIRLSSQAGVGPGNTNLFQIGVQNLGSVNAPTLPTSIYFLSLFTGLAPAVEVDVVSTPTAEGGATVADALGWSLFESGDAIFLSAPANDGIGGCAFSPPVDGFGTMGQTCGAGQFITFGFFTPRLFDVHTMTLSGLEIVAIETGNTAESCNDVTPCRITDVAVVPEPSSIFLLIAGLSGIAGAQLRRRARGNQSLRNEEA